MAAIPTGDSVAHATHLLVVVRVALERTDHSLLHELRHVALEQREIQVLRGAHRLHQRALQSIDPIASVEKIACGVGRLDAVKSRRTTLRVNSKVDPVDKLTPKR